MTKRQARIIFLLSIVSIVLALLISRRLWFRLDLTASKAYTIAPVSRNLYTEIPDQVRITYYVSDKLIAIHPIPGEIADLLREYAARSRGRIRLNIRDPVKTNMVQVVEELGIQPRQIQTVDKDQASVATVYTGIVIEYLDQAETLPVVFSLDTLEYDLTSRIRGLIRGAVREAGVIIGDADRQWERDYSYLNQTLQQAGFKIRPITPGEEIGDVLPLLFVLGGAEELDEQALAVIDRYIRGGGRVLFALDGVAVDTQYGMDARPVNDRGLLAMVSSYGVTVRPELVLDRSSLTLLDSAPGPGGSTQIRIVQYPHWISVLQENGNSAHPISASFAGADLFWASPLEFNLPKEVEGTILFTSTPDAWLMTKDFSINPKIEYSFYMEESATKGSRILAAALMGKFPPWELESLGLADGEAAPPAPKDSRIVVMGNTGIVYSPNVQYAQSQRNLDFFIQAADWLGNDDDIVGIRNRKSQAGRLDRIINLERRADAMAFARILNVVILPLAVIAVGLFMALRRRALLGTGRQELKHPDAAEKNNGSSSDGI